MLARWCVVVFAFNSFTVGISKDLLIQNQKFEEADDRSSKQVQREYKCEVFIESGQYWHRWQYDANAVEGDTRGIKFFI